MTNQSISDIRKGDVFWWVGCRYTAFHDAIIDNEDWVHITAQRTHAGIVRIRATVHDTVTIKTDN